MQNGPEYQMPKSVMALTLLPGVMVVLFYAYCGVVKVNDWLGGR